MNRTIATALILVLVGCASAAFAQGGGAPGVPGPGPGGPPEGPARVPAMMMGGTCPAMALAPPQAVMVERADNLQLSDDQKTKLRAVLAKSDQDLIALRSKAAEATRALRQAVFSADCDAAKLAQLTTDAQKAEGAVLAAEVKTWSDIKTILSADQLTQVRDMTIRRMGGMRGQRGPGGPGSPGGPGNPPPPNGGPEAPPPPPPPGQ